MRRIIESTVAGVAVAWLGACTPAHPPPPDTAEREVVDTIHGVEITDPYRWLEDGTSQETRTWIDEQNAYAELIVGESPLRDEIRARYGRLMRYDDVGSPTKAGDFEIFTMRRASEELPVIYRRPAPPEGELDRIDPNTEYEVVLDPHTISANQTTRFDILSVSPDGKLLIYSVRDGGQDETEIRIRDLEKGVDLKERYPKALYSAVSFKKDGSGFYYSRRSRETGARIYFHEMGTEIDNDVEIFGEGYDPRSFINVSELADGRYLLFTVNHGWARSEVHLQDLEKDGPSQPIVTGVDARFYPKFHDGLLYVRTNLDAPLNRVLSIDLRNPARDQWREVVPEGEDVLQDFSFIDGRTFLTYLRDVSGRIDVREMDGTSTGEIEVPEYHSARIRGASEGKAFLTLSSFTQPPLTYLLDLKSGTKEVWEERNLDFDPEGVTVEQVRYRSKDGTEVPMYVVHREDITMDGNNPTLLYGYGGFNSAQAPRFDAMGALWVERGGVFAMANLRGGSEFGERWHRDGMLENKQNVFDDFIAAAEWLIENRYTNPKKLAIRGVSNGGLLVASCLTQRPELYRAVLCGFPDLDMVRFYTFTKTNNMPALLEYGDASIPEQFEFLRKYSPYQKVSDGTAYPAVMLSTGDLDTRVPPLQARKLTARLQAATSSGLPVILRYHPKAGHAASRGLPLSRNIEDRAMEMTFLLTQLGAGNP
jgi:prolyl oligopeptidase